MTTAQIQSLEAAASAAIGRKEMRCQVAIADIYKAAGLLPADLEVPTGDRDWSRSQGKSLIVPWVDGSGYFERITEIEPGALICFHLGHVPHHVAIALSGGRLVHVMDVHGVQFAECIPAPWIRRLPQSVIWRLKP